MHILQLNTHRSSSVLHSLLNDFSTQRFHFLLIQEPYMFPGSSRPISHPAWVPFLPFIPRDQTGGAPEDSTIKTLIYANKFIPSTSLRSLDLPSNCLTAVSYSIQDHTFLLISSYAPPKQAHKLRHLQEALRLHPLSPTTHVVVGMDCNLHHPLWSPPTYRHTHREAEDLINIMSEAGLSLRLEGGIPTFYPPNCTHANTTIDLQWVSPTCLDWMVRCVTDVEHRFSHLSDHAAITSTILLPFHPPTLTRTRRHWKKLDASQFEDVLATELSALEAPGPPGVSSQAELDHHEHLLTQAITRAMDKCVPHRAQRYGEKRWWDKATLNPLKSTAQRLRRLYQRKRDEPTRLAYLEASHAFRNGVHQAKRFHWRSFLDSLTPSTLFTASKYATNDFAAPSLTVPPLRSRTGDLTSNPAEQAELLFQGTSAPTVQCVLDDLLPAADHPPPLPPPFTTLKASRVIDSLRPGKAPGSDEITNQALQAGGPALTQAVVAIANACLRTGLFPSAWKVARTAILWKPHKPDYADPSAYRPIALLSCLSKVVESMIANRLKVRAELEGILPQGHYGGRPQRSTEDALTHLTAWTKNQWSKGRYVGALFVDVKAAFPTVNPSRLIDTLRRQGFCPSLVAFVTAYLSNRSTTITFGDFESEPKSLSIGLPQGSPLSVILYILYNASLLTQASDIPETSSLGFIDDVTFVTADRSLNTVRQRLQILANRELDWGSRHGAAFDRRKSQWILLTHRPLPDPLPFLKLGDETLLPQTQVKWLGVVLDHKLTFSQHGRALEKSGTRVVLQLARLARTGWGIPLPKCKQLISALVHSRTDYAASVWHQHGKNTVVVKAIQRIDNMAQRFALGVFKTHPLVFLKHDTASPPALSRLDARAQKAVARLLSLPNTNPAAILARDALTSPRKAHRACLHHAVHSPAAVLSSLPAPIELISFADASFVAPHPRIRSLVAHSKEAAALFVTSQLGPLTGNDPTRSVAFSDGSLTPGEGTGAAALHLPSGTLSPANLGNLEYRTVYEAELVGVRMAADLALQHRTRLQSSYWFFIDNQPSIRALTQALKPSPGLTLRRQAVASLTRLVNTSPHSSVVLVWWPAHVGIQGNEDAYEAAKAATVTGEPMSLPLSLAAVEQQINARCKASVSDAPPASVLTRLRGVHDPTHISRALSDLPRHAATAIAQLRAGHTPLAAFLHRITAAESPDCPMCNQPETTEHFLLLCREYREHRTALREQLRAMKLGCDSHTLLTNPRAFKPLADYIGATKRFLKARQWRPPAPDDTQTQSQRLSRRSPPPQLPHHPLPSSHPSSHLPPPTSNFLARRPPVTPPSHHSLPR